MAKMARNLRNRAQSDAHGSATPSDPPVGLSRSSRAIRGQASSLRFALLAEASLPFLVACCFGGCMFCPPAFVAAPGAAVRLGFWPFSPWFTHCFPRLFSGRVSPSLLTWGTVDGRFPKSLALLQISVNHGENGQKSGKRRETRSRPAPRRPGAAPPPGGLLPSGTPSRPAPWRGASPPGDPPPAPPPLAVRSAIMLPNSEEARGVGEGPW